MTTITLFRYGLAPDADDAEILTFEAAAVPRVGERIRYWVDGEDTPEPRDFEVMFINHDWRYIEGTGRQVTHLEIYVRELHKREARSD